MAKDPKHVRYGSRPLTREDLGPLTYLPGIMSAREDGKLQIFNEAEGGFLEVHGDGMYGYVPKEGTWMAGAKKAAFNLLEYPGISDRSGYPAHATFAIPWFSDQTLEP